MNPPGRTRPSTYFPRQTRGGRKLCNPSPRVPDMTEDDFRTYIAAFNARDFAGFSKFYAEDVEFNLGDRKQIVGAQGIVVFYTGVFEHIAEELEILELIVAPYGDATHSPIRFTTSSLWP